MKTLHTTLLFLMFTFKLLICQAQSVTVYSKTGVLKGTYSTVAAALATTADGDSLLLSAHTFNESRLKGNYSVVYQGTIVGIDTTTIDAMGNGSVFDRCLGKIRDVIIQGGKFITGPGGSAGSGIVSPLGFLHLTGNTIIRNNLSQGTGGVLMFDGIIDGNVKIVNNVGTIYVGGVYANNDVVIKDNVVIANNFGNTGSAIALLSQGGTSIKKKLRIEGNVQITGNISDSSCTIYLGNSGCKVDIIGANIAHNITPTKKGGTIYTSDPGSFLPIDSIRRPDITIKNCRIFNPKSDFSRQTEIYLGFNTIPVKCHTEGCWWGNSDTTGLIVAEAGTDFTMPNWAVANWYGKPFSSAGTAVSAQMMLNTGAALPANTFPGLEGKFSATAGSFPSPTAVINSGNLIASDYYYPASGPFTITASIDADTFRANNKGALGIKEAGFESVKIYPNPASDFLHISHLAAGITLHIYDASGRIVLQQGYLDAQDELRISVAHLPAGSYIINLYNQADQLGTAKFVKE